MNAFNLIEGEELLYECYGKLRQQISKMRPSGKPRFSTGVWRTPIHISMSSGKIFITNYRIIAQGKINVKGGRRPGLFTGLVAPLISGGSRRKRIRSELSPYGYEIPIKNIGRLCKFYMGIRFNVMEGNHTGTVRIKPRKLGHILEEKIERKKNLEENIHKLCEILREFTEIKELIHHPLLYILISTAIIVIFMIAGSIVGSILGSILGSIMIALGPFWVFVCWFVVFLVVGCMCPVLYVLLREINFKRRETRRIEKSISIY